MKPCSSILHDKECESKWLSQNAVIAFIQIQIFLIMSPGRYKFAILAKQLTKKCKNHAEY